ncbi:major facilitator superfamily domain-containing protein [Pisolithus croceorrhizus]|nr:major facilitator superfamily domain-containing protein [Pisolithus croceorrhizus]KAI6163453.1 major facilitator superfamily domain-containing protein [Pisolithus thermaeus]
MPDKIGVASCPTDVSNVQEPSPVNLGPERERKLWRKIDFRLVPMISFMYLFSFMDRGEYFRSGNAKLEGLMTQLHLTGSQFNVALSVFFISYSLFEFPANVILQFVRPSRWLPGIMFAWGIAMTFMGLVKSYPQLTAMRFLLGIAEAGFYPGVVFYLSMWYPKYKLIYRVALFTSSAAIAGTFSGLLAYAIGFMNNVGHLEGWSWIFITQGLATIVVCLVGVFGLVDYPDTAKFLSAEEKRFIEQQRSTFHPHITCSFLLRAYQRSIWKTTERVLWQYNLNWSPVYGVTFFLPFGYDTAISQLLTVPVYVGTTISMISVAHFSDRMKIRFPFIIVSEFVGLAGYIIQITDASTGVKYFGTFLAVIGTYSGVPCTVGWLANNLCGKYKRAGGMAIQVGMGNLGGIIASNIFQTRDEPRYILAFAIEIGFLCMGLIVTVFSVYAYHRANTSRIASAKRDGINEAKYAVGLYVI